MKRKIIVVVGARPNYMKAAPLIAKLSQQTDFIPVLVHTGQHYDDNMSKLFFNQLRLPKPDIYLGIGSGSHAEQTGKIMIEFEKICFSEKPDLVIVVGDVNSTLACALVAAKLSIPVAHIEAGLRSFDRTMPEEINRILTDQISDYLFTTCEDANLNLLKEGVAAEKIFFVGNVMIDTLLKHIGVAGKSKIFEELYLKADGRIKKYALLTLHRPSNVDDYDIFKGILSALVQLSADIPIIFPAHPRTVQRIKQFKLEDLIAHVHTVSESEIRKIGRKILITPPLGYIDFLGLMANANFVLTDSGGIQEETTILGIPCLTLRNNTERQVTIQEGTNMLVGNAPDKILEMSCAVLKTGSKNAKIPKYWDGKAGARIVNILREKI